MRKRERKRIYLEILNKLETHSFRRPYICCNLVEYISSNWDKLEETFPEFFLFKRKRLYPDGTEKWWDHNDLESRKTVLAFAAAMCD